MGGRGDRGCSKLENVGPAALSMIFIVSSRRGGSKGKCQTQEHSSSGYLKVSGAGLGTAGKAQQ